MHYGNQLRRLIFVVAASVVVCALYRTAHRPSRFSRIDYEVQEGYATDRWGHTADPSEWSAGTEWGQRQKANYDTVSTVFYVACVPAAVYLVVTSLRRKRGAGSR